MNSPLIKQMLVVTETLHANLTRYQARSSPMLKWEAQCVCDLVALLNDKAQELKQDDNDSTRLQDDTESGNASSIHAHRPDDDSSPRQ